MTEKEREEKARSVADKLRPLVDWPDDVRADGDVIVLTLEGAIALLSAATE